MIFDRNEGDNRHPLLIFVLTTVAIGALGSIFTQPNIPTWYAQLNQPSMTPPNWFFGPVWIALYIMMAVAAWRVWRITGLASRELGAWGVQLALNFAWSAIFFSLHRIDLALGEILVLDLAIIITALLFWRRDRIAGMLLLPYLAWTSFAALLTYRFWQLNP